MKPLIVSDSDDQTVAAITAELETEGLVHLRFPALKETFARLQEDLKPHLESYPTCEGMFFGYQTKRFGSVFSKSDASWALATHPVVTGVMNKILGPFCDRYQINLTQAIRIEPGEKEQLPHRDDEMFPFPHQGTHFMVNAMWALSDFSEENGGTRIWPRSHKDDLTREPSYDDVYYATMEAGDVVLYLGSALHCGGANRSEAPRDGLVISYSLGWLRQSENQYLAYPPEVAKRFPVELQELIGYRAHRPNLGWLDGQEPMRILADDVTEGPVPTLDLLPPEIEAMVKEMAA
ncbi:phytanoyl-CoA dioxygenase family protein [Kordiimonas marina]|uniref:phytanoyl-CoA dioxygenase family protein n=1 Tax=Kordiimonas marina TaxID=2872312 RepID=UPI001FF6FC43|nr:phytanoyl-CoA dioxygenase family protein [Kordiimonas marina]MCJ9427487.1 phytanoyl-CoA dioxygenase family protein [Kordiimonas marina]